jgi:hypothetical protein
MIEAERRVGDEGYIATIYGVHMLRQDMRDGPCHASGQSGNDLLGTDLVWGRYTMHRLGGMGT